LSKRGKGRKPGWEDLHAQIEGGGDPAGYYLLHGAEEFGRNRAVRWLFEQLAPSAARDFNVETFHADGLEVERLLDAYRAYPVMADRRLLTLKGCDRLSADQCRALEPMVTDSVDSTIVIATGEKVDARRRLFKQMATLGQAVEFRALYDNEVPAWITRHCREEGIAIEPEGADVLRIYVGPHPRELASEIEKLALYVGAGHTITRDSVIALASSSGEASIFGLTDAIAVGDRKKASSLLQALLNQGEEPIRIVAMINRHLNLLLKTAVLEAQGLPAAELSRRLGVSPYFLPSYRSQASKANSRELWEGLEALSEADLNLKSHSRRHSGLIMDLCLSRVQIGAHQPN
jgi:DNA polymerase-3 subunit delta